MLITTGPLEIFESFGTHITRLSNSVFKSLSLDLHKFPMHRFTVHTFSPTPLLPPTFPRPTTLHPSLPQSLKYQPKAHSIIHSPLRLFPSPISQFSLFIPIKPPLFHEPENQTTVQTILMKDVPRLSRPATSGPIARPFIVHTYNHIIQYRLLRNRPYSFHQKPRLECKWEEMKGIFVAEYPVVRAKNYIYIYILLSFNLLYFQYPTDCSSDQPYISQK